MSTKTPAKKKTPSKKAAAKKTPLKRTGPAAKKTAAKKTAAKKTAVDPRIKARRIEVQRTAGRRRLRTLGLLVAVTLVTIGAIALVNSSWLDVDDFEVVGTANTPAEQVEQASGILIKTPLLDVDLALAEQQIERLPWVLTASVDRRWTGTIVIEITEREPVTVVATDDSGLVLVDGSGRQLELVDRRPPGYLLVAGIVATGIEGQPAPPETQAVLRLMGELTPQLEAEVDQIVVDEGTLYLDLRSGGRALVGDDTALDQKVLSLETILQRVDLRCLWEIDVRVPSAPAVTRIDAAGNPRATLTDLSDCT